MTTVNAPSGFSIQEMFQTIANKIGQNADDLKTQMNNLEGSTLSDGDMLKLQFQVNQYNTLLETVSTVSKSLTDEAKQLAQRAN